jgi:hypothetical protein
LSSHAVAFEAFQFRFAVLPEGIDDAAAFIEHVGAAVSPQTWRLGSHSAPLAPALKLTQPTTSLPQAYPVKDAFEGLKMTPLRSTHPSQVIPCPGDPDPEYIPFALPAPAPVQGFPFQRSFWQPASMRAQPATLPVVLFTFGVHVVVGQPATSAALKLIQPILSDQAYPERVPSAAIATVDLGSEKLNHPTLSDHAYPASGWLADWACTRSFFSFEVSPLIPAKTTIASKKIETYFIESFMISFYHT